MTQTINDPELQAAVREVLTQLEVIVPRLGHHPAPSALALLSLGVWYSYNSGIITKEDPLGQVGVFWDQFLNHKPSNLN